MLELAADEPLLCHVPEDGAISAVHLEPRSQPLNIISHANGNNLECVSVCYSNRALASEHLFKRDLAVTARDKG